MGGLFVTFEGIEHCGKSTQAERLTAHLKERGHDVVLTREPGGTAVGRSIREVVLHGREEIDDVSELLLFAADRAHHVATLIRPALATGKVVISDRFFDSTRAYQGFGRGMDPDLIDRTVQLATGGLVPDVTILMDIDVDTSRARGDDTTDRIEQDSDAFFDRVRLGFLDIAAHAADRFVVLDGNRSIDEITARITRIVDQRLSSHAE